MESSSAHLTPRERVFKTLNGEAVDKLPNLNIIMTFSANYIGVPYKKYVTDYRYLVEGNIKCCDRFGIDMVSAISDPFRETSGFGANIIFPEDDVPKCTDFLLKDYSQINGPKIIKPGESARMEDRLKAVEMYRTEVGERYPILGWVEGAFAEAADLRGVNQIMFDFYEEPEALLELLNICNEQAALFAVEQIRAGADFIGVGDAAASLIGPQKYTEFVLPFEKKLVETIHKNGAKAKLHICGNISPILGVITDTGADMIDIDWMVDFREANRLFRGKCSACGNFDPVEIMLRGSVQDVCRAVEKCMADGDNTTFIAAGCEIPKFTPQENMLMVDETLRNKSYL